MPKKKNVDPVLRELERELQTTTQALKEAYTRFDYVCDSELIDACIYEINALKARGNYLLRRIKERSGLPVESGIPRARVAGPVQETRDAPVYVAASAVKGGSVCRS